jgi:hypothetical protein
MSLSRKPSSARIRRISMALLAPATGEMDVAWITDKRLDDRPPKRAE